MKMNKIRCNVNLRCSSCGNNAFKIEKRNDDECIFVKCLTQNCNGRMSLVTAMVVIESKFAMAKESLKAL